MAEYKLTYFDFHGGRGEPARMAFAMAGIPFEDDRVPVADWPQRKAGTPFGALPTLEVDGQTLAQSNAINRFVGERAGLYPSDPWQAALCDETMEAVEDVVNHVQATMFLPEDEKKPKREALAKDLIPAHLGCLEKRLEQRGGRYFADGRLTIADLKVLMLMRQLTSGVVDYVPTDLPDRFAPKLLDHAKRVYGDEKVAAYFAERGIPV